MSTTLTLALAQVAGSPDPGANLSAARRLAAQADSADLLCFPEMFMAVPAPGEPLSRVAEPLDGPFVRSLAALARERGLHLLAGVWEAVPGRTRVHNTAVLLAPDGTVAAAYRKLHLFDALSVRESDRMIAGAAPPPVVSVAGLPVGVAICYDLRFPEVFRHLAAAGAELVVVPAAWYAGPSKEDHWLTLLRARALENTLYAAGVGLAGAGFCGRSAVFDPFGVPAASAGEGEELLAVRVSRARVAEVRARLPCLTHLRPDVLGGTAAGPLGGPG